MSSTTDPPHQALVGVGFGLRWDFLDDLVDRLTDSALSELPFLEVSPENYMRRGGYIPESLEHVAEHVPLITHGLMMSLGGLDPFEDAYFDQLRTFIRRFASPWHSDHLCVSGVGGRIFHDLLPIPQTEAAARHVAARIREAQDRLQRPMAVENISYYLQLGRPDLEETEFISHVLEEADCGLLLDVNNVYVNAQNHGFDAQAWIERIDVSRVRQVHVAGHEFRPDNGLIIDTHGAPVTDPVFELFTCTIAKTGPVAVILERDNNVPDLDEMLRERQLVDDAYQRGLALWHAGNTQRRRSALSPPRPHEVGRLRAVHRVLEHAVKTTSDEALERALRAGYPSIQLAPEDAQSLRDTDVRRVRVYRDLVRANLVEAIANQIPRTVARLGTPLYERYVERFCEQQLPRSQILRDVAFEFAAWAAPLLDKDERAAPYIADLARYELLEFDVYAAQRIVVTPLAEEMLPASPVAFDTTTRLSVFSHAVHLLADDTQDDTIPNVTDSAVLAYRDSEGCFRQLELTSLAAQILAALLLGESFAPAVQRACTLLDLPVDEHVIEGISTVIADLAERGCVFGAAAVHDELHHHDPPSPFFRWLMGPSVQLAP